MMEETKLCENNTNLTSLCKTQVKTQLFVRFIRKNGVHPNGWTAKLLFFLFFVFCFDNHGTVFFVSFCLLCFFFSFSIFWLFFYFFFFLFLLESDLDAFLLSFFLSSFLLFCDSKSHFSRAFCDFNLKWRGLNSPQ